MVGGKKAVYIFDRGYPSAGMFLDLLAMGQKFLFRLGSAHFKREQKSMTGDDCVVQIVFNKGRISAAAKENPEAARKMAAVGSLKLRFVRIKLPSGDEKAAAANLTDKDFSTEEIEHLIYSALRY